MARPPKNNTASQKELTNETPLMKQYNATKQKYPDALLLFRVGDFYETFGEDAVKTSQALGITLTSRNNGSASETELAGFPHHALDTYLPKLVRAGYRVAVCDQLEKPVAGRVVKRGVTEVVTPGVASSDTLLEQGKNNYLASVALSNKGDKVGLAFLDISTGEFVVTEGAWDYAEKTLQGFNPSEIIYSKKNQDELKHRFSDRFCTTLEDWIYSHDYGREKTLEHFGVQTLKGFGIEEMTLAQIAAGATLHYLAATQNNNIRHVSSIARLQPDRYVWLDKFTVRNLELITPNFENGKSLLQVLDHTISPMGARMMKKWVMLPLKNRVEVEKRLAVVEFLVKNPDIRQDLEVQIRDIGDLERLISKVPLGKINPRELRQIARALTAIDRLQAILGEVLRGGDNATTPLALRKMTEQLNPLSEVRAEIERQIVAEPPVNLTKGGVIADGILQELDDWRNIVRNSQEILLQIQQREIEKTGISSLKIGFNNVFGYYIEVTAKYKHIEVPQDWVRKQTLANAERYISTELKDLEEKILSADEKILGLEEYHFQRLVSWLLGFIEPIQRNAQTVAVLDCLRSFAAIAVRNHYVKPELSDDFVLDIREGRHAVIEQQLPVGESYIPNDVLLNTDNQQILMITGPNMAGKSALLRQTALICLMAQMGSFVPAESAHLGLLDKVFTRVGASDNISSGESTFMVEMNETASIMNNISDRSLILLDEIGRGTSTYDGISIAWSIAEFLHKNAARPRTLFATHYHELNELAEKFERIKNYHVATKEVNQKVIFLRKLTEGGSHHSFGIHVAKMAGMPPEIVERANEILAQLEQKHIEFAENQAVTEGGEKPKSPKDIYIGEPKFIEKNTSAKARQALRQLSQPMQLNIFDTGDPRMAQVKEMLENLNLNAMTPIECMMKLLELKKLVE